MRSLKDFVTFFQVKGSKKVATTIHRESHTGQKVIFDLFIYARTFQNLAGIDEHVDWCRKLIGCNF